MNAFEKLRSNFLKNAAERADKVAIARMDGTELTYGQLKEKADALGAAIKKAGAEDGEVVGILMSRGENYVAAVLGCILKGYGYVQMDVDYPKERIDFIINDSKVKIIIDDEFFSTAQAEFGGAPEGFGAAWKELSTAQAESGPAMGKNRETADALECAFAPEESATSMIFYTSGSTGNPKGVRHSWKSLFTCLEGLKAMLAPDETDIFGSVAPFTFVAFQIEILLPLLTGATVVIAEKGISKSPEALADFLYNSNITVCFIAPKVLKYFHSKGGALRTVFTGSERISNLTPENYRLVGLYGMTETGAPCVYIDIDRAYENTPLGRPAPGYGMYLLDEDGQEADEGEICLTGCFMTEYINNPEKTREALEKNPFGEGMLLHTGDIGKRLEDGNIIYLNRKDWMVKINGQRVEPGEVENAIKKIPGVSEAVVRDFKNKYGQIYIAAYFTADTEIPAETVKAELSGKLPAYMIPSFICQLDAMPLNVNGKLDRNALKEPDATLFLAEYKEPENEMQRNICQAMERILGISRIGINDDFFAIGGDSIKAMALTAECRGITSEDVFQGKTPREIERLAKGHEKTEENFDPAAETMNLSESQMGVYLDSTEDPESLKYNIPMIWSFPVNMIDVERLIKAVAQVTENHEAFHIGIDGSKGVPEMKKLSGPAPEVKVELSSESEYMEIKKNFVRPFEMNGSFMYRIQLVQTEVRLYMLFDMYHMLFDGTSLEVFEKELKSAYESGNVQGEECTPFLESYRESLFEAGENYKFFESYIGDSDVSCGIIPDVDKKELASRKETVERYTEVSSLEVEQFIGKQKITENTLFGGAFALTLSKFAGMSDAVFASVNSGRRSSDMLNSIGMFVQTFPVKVQIDEELSVSDFLANVQTSFHSALKHSRLSFAELSRRTGVNASTKFVYQGEMLNGFNMAGLEVELESLKIDDAMGDLDFMVLKKDGRYGIKVDGRSSMYSRKLLESFADTYIQIAEELITAKKVKDIKLLGGPAESLLEGFNNTEVPYDDTETVTGIFKKNAKTYSDNLAISFKDRTLTYGQLDEITDRLALELRRRGIGRGDFVSILIERSEFMLVAAFGALKAGAAYQPLDPAYPTERLNFMTKDAGAKMLIADRKLRDLVSEYTGEILYTDEMEEQCRGEISAEERAELDRVAAQTLPDDNFVILYTSGTTGVPKGCLIAHRNVVCLYHSHVKLMEIDNASRVATYASFGFDAAIVENTIPLMAGAGIYIIPEEIRLDIKAIDDLYIKNKITHGFMTTQVARMFAMMTKCDTLRVFAFGGEKLVPFSPPDNFKTFNLYGPSETTVYVTSFRVRDDGNIQPIGKANDNTKLYIADSQGRRLPAGACGELWVAGPQVSKGYLNRPEKTAEAFAQNPFTTETGYETIYKTGDIARILPDGNVDYVGRRDGQVKIRGFRIELTEVEQVIRSFPEIENATVNAADDAAGGKFLAAYIVSDKTINIDELNAFIGERKPAYMIPKVTMQIEEIPLNVNGKVDRKKLPAPELKVEEILPPENEMQEKILKIASEILGTTGLGINTDLFYAGLSSIGCIKFNAELQDEFGVPVQTKDLKKAGNVKNLSEFIENAGRNQAEAEKAGKVELSDFPITKTQEGIFVECMAHSDSTIYNIPLLLKIDGAINMSRLKSAIVQAVSAHSYMCTQLYYDTNGRVCQRRPLPGCFSRDDIQTIKGESIDRLKDSLVKPFGLINERLFRIALIEADGNYLFIDVHHIISDGTSINILLEDIGRAYSGEKISDETYTGFNKAEDELRARNSTEFDDAKDYYTALLGGVEDMNFLPPSDMHGRARKGSGSVRFKGCDGLATSLKNFAQEKGVSANAVLCSAFGYTLSLYNATANAVFTTVHNGRDDSRLRRTFSMLVKTLPVVYDPKSENILENISAAGKQIIDSEVNDVYSFAEISREFGVKSDVMLVFQGDGFEFKEFCGLSCTEIPLQLSEEKAPFVCQVAFKDGALDFAVDYDKERFTEEFALSMTRSFERAVSEFITKEKFSDIELAGEEQTIMLDELNHTEVPYDESQNAMEIFKEAASKNPDKAAVFYEGRSISYKELDDVTDRLAAFVNSKGIGRDEFVPVLVGRNEYMAIASVGVVKAGAAYQPLDPTYPAERLNFMVKDSKARLLICDREFRDILSEFDGDVLYTDEIEGLPEAEKTFEKEILPSDALIIIYTSGTTGTPKGCVLEHKNIVCFFWNHINVMDIDENSRLANYASFGFDAGLMDIFAALMSGATLYIIPEEIRLDFAALDKYYIDNGITHGFMTTQVGRMFAENTKCKTLKKFEMGGEKLVPFNPQPGFDTINGYGPSETIAYVTQYVIVNDSSVQPIGVPHNNTKLYIIDKFGHRLPAGACGELCIAGNQVGRGYLGRPEKTAECFVTNPFGSEHSYERMYKTGDTVRMLTDGNYEYVGRGDGQVKIRGFRIELTEVEQVIRSFPPVKNATVQAMDNPSGGKMLVAYIVGDSEIDIAALNDFIRSQKPAYMVPQVTMQIEEIPLNVNSKVDKRKLPVPEVSASREGLEPEGEAEKRICQMYGEVLGIKKVYADDDFFEIGGTSISALQLVVKLENEGFNVVYKNLFENTTPKELAAFITGGVKTKDYFAPTGEEAKKYDYSALEYNIPRNLPEIKAGPIGTVLLTGATGFLGSHVLEYLLDNTDSHIVCIVREKSGLSAEERLETMLNFYFEKDLDDNRITVVSGDLTDSGIEEKLKGLGINTILNCAADVRHFGSEEELMKGNFASIDVLIRLAKETGALLVHASSLSVSGESVNGHIPPDRIFKENDLNIGQSLENMYCRSKYLAEQRIIDEISRGLRAKVIRFGNLMARTPDGEFQINAEGNGFLKTIKGYVALGCYPVDMMDVPIEFSPIDYSARAMVVLAGTPDKFTVFHANNSHHVHMANIFEVMNRLGIRVDFVSPEKFAEAYAQGMQDPKISKQMSVMLAYKNDAQENPAEAMEKADYADENKQVAQTIERRKVNQSEDYTTKALYRLGFSWPLVDYAYLERLMEIQKENGFFDM